MRMITTTTTKKLTKTKNCGLSQLLLYIRVVSSTITAPIVLQVGPAAAVCASSSLSLSSLSLFVLSTFRFRSSFHLFGGEIRVDVVVVGIRNNCCFRIFCTLSINIPGTNVPGTWYFTDIFVLLTIMFQVRSNSTWRWQLQIFFLCTMLISHNCIYQ